MRTVYLLLLNIFLTYCIHAQKPKVTPEIAQAWQRLDNANAAISNNGKYLLYVIGSYPSAANDKLVIQSTSLRWKTEIKNYSYPFQFTNDSKKVICKLKGDSLVIVTLGTGETEYLPNVKSFNLPKEGVGNLLAYQLKDENATLILKNLSNNKERFFSNINDYSFSDDGTVLVINKKIGNNKALQQELTWINIEGNAKEKSIWSGSQANSITFSSDHTKIAFITKENNESVNAIWCYQKGEEKAKQIASDHSPGLEDLFTIKQIEQFNKKGNYLFFSLSPKNTVNKVVPDDVKVDIWSYADPKLQSEQLKELNSTTFPGPPVKHMTAINLNDNRIIRIEKENETINYDAIGDEQLLLMEYGKGNKDEWNWNYTSLANIYLISLKNEKRQLIGSNQAPRYSILNSYIFSPGEKFIVYYDPKTKNYYSFNIASQITTCITKGIETAWTSFIQGDEPDADYRPFWYAGFTEDECVLIYDQYDIWKISLSGRTLPVNLTNGYGKKHHIVFRIANMRNSNNGIYKKTGTLILNAFNRQNKDNGFYKLQWNKPGDPLLLTMQPCLFMGPDEGFGLQYPMIKAKNAEVYLVSRQTAAESPNLFLTKDFKQFTPVSDYYPERSYNWLTSELHTWKMLDSNFNQGILYKPGNFDSTKKYPVLFYYYEDLSDELHQFKKSEYSDGVLNIPYFVSSGYLVFVPDIPKIMGHPGPSAVNAVVSAAKYLSGMPWVNAQKLGIQGHSFGGFETNYILTHSDIFAAAMSSSSMSDFISVYNSVNPLGDGSSRQKQFEIYHDAIGASMWQRPDLYIENAPVLYADKVTTPVLMMNNVSDGDVPFSQGIEFFTALRRLGKKVWMLQYDGAGHMVFDDGQAKDLTLRMKQFFDHYLMDKPAPVWMTRGIPAKDKGIKDGLEYDTEIKTPGEGLLLPGEKEKIDSFKYRKPFLITIP